MTNSVMCRWVMKTENAVKLGAQCEVYKQGMLKARFDSSNKLAALEFVFDIMSFMQQLQRASGGDSFEVVPNTVEMAGQPSAEARVVFSAEAPHLVESANPAWCALHGLASSDAVVGRSLSAVVHGAETAPAELAKLSAAVKSGCAGLASVTMYDAAGAAVPQLVRVYPLSASGVVTHFMGLAERVGDDEDENKDTAVVSEDGDGDDGNAQKAEAAASRVEMAATTRLP